MSFLRRHKSSDENIHCDGIILENYIQPEITSDRRVHHVLISSILLAIVLGVAVIKLPLPSFLTGAKEGGYNPEQAIEINGDAELKQALESKVMSSYIVNNVSFTGPHMVDYFGIVANTEDFLRLDYDCRIYSKKMVKYTQRRNKKPTSEQTRYREKTVSSPCPEQHKTEASPITIANQDFTISGKSYVAEGIGSTYPLNFYSGVEADIFEDNKYEEDHADYIGFEQREIYTIYGVPYKSKVSFAALIGNGQIEPIESSRYDKIKFKFGGDVSNDWDDALITRKKLLIAILTTIFLAMMLSIWYMRSGHYDRI